MTETNIAGKTPENQGTVASLIDEYDLSGVCTEMEQLWATNGERRMGLRNLADVSTQYCSNR